MQDVLANDIVIVTSSRNLGKLDGHEDVYRPLKI